MLKYQPYRDEPFQRSCEDRYEPIKDLCSLYKRQFSVLDIGANYGWFGQRLVRDFDCVYVGIDNKVIDPHERIWHIPRHVTGGDLVNLSRCEQFDVVLCLSVLHHFKDYRDAFHGAIRLGEYTFFEIPGEDDVNARAPERHAGIHELFKDAPKTAEFQSHVSNTMRPMYCVKNYPFIKEQTLDMVDRGAPAYANYKLRQDFSMSIIEIDRTPVRNTKEIRDYIPGMNLHNFRLLGGKAEMPDDDHPDKQPWNYIIGDGIKPIDTAHVK